MKKNNLIELFNGGIVFYLCIAALIVVLYYYVPIIRNESEVGIALSQIAPAISEKPFYSGDELNLPFTCSAPTADRLMLHITATSDADNVGYMTLMIDGAEEKTLRTSLFRKVSGTYSIPIYKKSLNQLNKSVLRIRFSGGDKKKPLIYVAQMAKNKAISYQIALQEEKGNPVPLPKNTVYPRSIEEYKAVGECQFK